MIPPTILPTYFIFKPNLVKKILSKTLAITVHKTITRYFFISLYNYETNLLYNQANKAPANAPSKNAQKNPIKLPSNEIFNPI